MLNNNLIEEILNGSSQSKISLINKVKPLILSNIKKHGCTDSYDDMYQDSVEILFYCINKFDSKKNIPFISYYQKALKYYYYKNERDNEINTVSLNDAVVNDEITLEEIIPDKTPVAADQIIDKEEIEELYKSINKLSQKQQWIIYQNFFQNKSLIDISKESNMHYQTIVKLKARALKELRKHFKYHSDMVTH